MLSAIDKCVPAESFCTTKADGAVRLHMEESGPLSDLPETVVDMFERTVEHFPNHVALAVKRGGKWKKWTYREYYQECRIAAKALIKLGLEEFHAVAMIGFNSPEWVISHLGAIMAGGLATGIYTTNSAEACHYVALNSSANIIVVEDEFQLQKILEVWERLPLLKAVIQYSGQPREKRKNVYSWSEFMALGSQASDDLLLNKRIKALAPNKCCCLIFTSGTTGNPKGVMMSHDNLVWTAKSFSKSADEEPGKEISISYLPLSHLAATFGDIYLGILNGSAIYFAQPDALKGTIMETVKEVRPTFFFGVPRIWEKIYENLRVAINSLINDPELLSWAKDIGYRGNMSRMAGGPLPPEWEKADRLLFQKVRAILGIDRCKTLLAGAAPISREALNFFLSVGMPLLDCYGMSETTAGTTTSTNECFKIGSVGKVLTGISLKIVNPDPKDGSGEICVYGRNICMGYLNMKEKTEELLDDQGWAHSGDIGRIDKDGFLYITGRIKELIITSGGENISPVLIENIVKEEIPLLNNCILIGDKRKFLSMLLTLKVEFDSETGEPTEKLTDEAIKLCHEMGSKAVTVQEVKRNTILREAIQRGIERYNQKAVSRPQKIQKWAILDADFSIPGGELGPTLKLRRSVVTKKYENAIEQFYSPSSKL